MILKKHVIAESHKRQFSGEDYQYVAQDLAEEHGVKFEDDEFTTLQSSPNPDCDCGFCKSAPWRD